MNASSSITVWEWEAQNGIWVPFSPKVCQNIEDEFRRSSGRGKVDLSQHNVNELYGCELDFSRMRQVNMYLKDETTRVRRQTYPCNCPFARGISWKWFSDFKWQPYDVQTSNYIEEAFQRKSKKVDLRRSPIRIPNIINFSTNDQINKKTKKSRRVEREETKDQYPQANHETSNILGLHGSQPTYNPPVPIGSSTSMTHGSNNSVYIPPYLGSNSAFTPVVSNVGSGTSMLSNNNRLTHFTPSLTNNHSVSNFGASSMTPHINHTSMYSRLPTYHTVGQLPIGNSVVPPSHGSGAGLMSGNMNLHYGGGKIGGVPQASGGVPMASSNLMFQRPVLGATALSPTPKPPQSIGGPLCNFTRPVHSRTKPDDECAICLESLSTPSDYDNNPTEDVQCVSADILQLLMCKHIFHRICLQRLYESGTSPQSGSLRCPTCKTIHGVMKGNQPESGTMTVTTNSSDIPGYPGYGSIVITYNFRSGIQGPNHPNPGQRYSAAGTFPRTCYLPNNPKGKKVEKLLQVAFDRRLVFTVGRSVTTGQDNRVVWNDIHHKTEGYGNSSGYGYPDPNYLDNVLAELAAHGVTEDT